MDDAEGGVAPHVWAGRRRGTWHRMPEAEVAVAEVNAFKTKSGNVRYVAQT